jgi:hypothetical protein
MDTALTCRFYGRVAYDTDYDGVALSDSIGERMAKILQYPSVSNCRGIGHPVYMR